MFLRVFFLFPLLQYVHSAFLAMLGHLRSKAFDKFKSDLELSLKSGKGFAASTRDCIQSSMLEFDTGLKGRYPFYGHVLLRYTRRFRRMQMLSCSHVLHVKNADLGLEPFSLFLNSHNSEVISSHIIF